MSCSHLGSAPSAAAVNDPFEYERTKISPDFEADFLDWSRLTTHNAVSNDDARRIAKSDERFQCTCARLFCLRPVDVDISEQLEVVTGGMLHVVESTDAAEDEFVGAVEYFCSFRVDEFVRVENGRFEARPHRLAPIAPAFSVVHLSFEPTRAVGVAGGRVVASDFNGQVRVEKICTDDVADLGWKVGEFENVLVLVHV